MSAASREPAPVTRLAPVLALVLGGAAIAGAPASARAASWSAVVGKSQITLHVYKKGLLSAAAHDHLFVPTKWRATASLDEAQPSGLRAELVIAADSLRDHQPSLSSGDRDKVNRQAAGPDVLDAAHHPEIRFTSSGGLAATGTDGGEQPGRIEGVLSGTLSLHGRERTVPVRVVAKKDASGWWAHGSARFKQSDFGIEPYSGFLGTIAVEDEVQLDYEIFLAPAP